MATKYLSATSAWSSATWWTTAGGSTTTAAPGVGDSADLNGRTLTIDQDITCDALIGATGTLAVSGNRTINANVGNTSAGFGCTLSGANQTVTINGNVQAGITTTRITLNGASTILNVNGNVVGGGSGIRGISITTCDELNITGNVTGGSTSSTAFGIGYGPGAITIVGDVTATSASGIGYLTTGACTIDVTGNVTTSVNGTIPRGILLSNGSPTLTINGNVTSANGSSLAGLTVSTANATATINGNVTGSSAHASGFGATISAGSLTINGDVIAGSTGTHAIEVTGGTLEVVGNIEERDGLTTIHVSAGTFTYSPASDDTVEYGGATLYATQGSGGGTSRGRSI